jgi:hypothetical protein
MKITVKTTVSDGQGEDGSGGTETQPSDPGKKLRFSSCVNSLSPPRLWQVARSVQSQLDSAEQSSPDLCSTFTSHYFGANFPS